MTTCYIMLKLKLPTSIEVAAGDRRCNSCIGGGTQIALFQIVPLPIMEVTSSMTLHVPCMIIVFAAKLKDPGLSTPEVLCTLCPNPNSSHAGQVGAAK